MRELHKTRAPSGKKTELGELPKHIAIIMDGNGRWAASKGLSRLRGHKEGAKNAMEIAKYCGKLGIKYLTLFAFSSENWKRPELEVSGIMSLLNRYLIRENETLTKNQVKLSTIGALENLPKNIRESLANLKEKTKKFEKSNLVLALSYGSRDEITRAVKQIAADVRDRTLSPENINEELISRYLDTKNIPDPDLFIRTSGEMRLSNFLLWQSSYAELYITKKNWPEFSKDDLDRALKVYSSRDRRYGRLSEQGFLN